MERYFGQSLQPKIFGGKKSAFSTKLDSLESTSWKQQDKVHNDSEDTVGNWCLQCDNYIKDSSGLTEANRIWNSLTELQKEKPHLFSNSKSRIRRADGTESIVIALDSRNAENVLQTAEAIRRKLDFPFVMYYYKSCNNVLYFHTPTNEFHEFKNQKWHSLSIKDGDGLLDDEPAPSSKNTSQESITESNLPLPSEVTDREFIYMPSTEKEIEAMQTSGNGKWMVFTSTNILEHDKMWRALIPLYQNGTLLGLKASTCKASQEKVDSNYEGYVVNCYTNCSEDVLKMKAVALAIKSFTKYRKILYYKTNSASINGEYRCEGVKLITKYMLTLENYFYQRDMYKRWELVKF